PANRNHGWHQREALFPGTSELAGHVQGLVCGSAGSGRTHRAERADRRLVPGYRQDDAVRQLLRRCGRQRLYQRLDGVRRHRQRGVVFRSGWRRQYRRYRNRRASDGLWQDQWHADAVGAFAGTDRREELGQLLAYVQRGSGAVEPGVLARNPQRLARTMNDNQDISIRASNASGFTLIELMV